MKFSEVPANPAIKQKLIQTVTDHRVSHAQLFFGPEGSSKLALAIAYAQLINCTPPPGPSGGGPGRGSDSCGLCPSCQQFQQLAHPDLHFFFPTNTGKLVSKDSSSLKYIREWRTFLLENDFQVTLNDWYDVIGIENKQGIINKYDAEDINHILGYKTYQSEYKVVIIWMAEKLFHSVAPKLLKILEEPPDKTLFLLISENPDQMIPTILSRCLPVKIPRVPDDVIREYLIRKAGCPEPDSEKIAPASKGNLLAAISRCRQDEENMVHFETFRNWMRLCYSRKLPGLIQFAGEATRLGREKQKSLLLYGLNVAWNSSGTLYKPEFFCTAEGEEYTFISNFASFIKGDKLIHFAELLNTALFHIERNAYAPTLFLNLSLKLSSLMKNSR